MPIVLTRRRHDPQVIARPFANSGLDRLVACFESVLWFGPLVVCGGVGCASPCACSTPKACARVFKRPGLAFVLFWRVGLDVVVWNWRILRGTLATGDKVPKGDFVVVPLDLRDPNGLAVLAAILCVIPGTIWSELALDRSALLVHVFDMKHAEEEIQTIKNRYEKPLMEIFQ